MGNFYPSNSRNAHVAISIIEPSIIQTTLLLLFIHVPLHSFAVTRKILQSLASPPPQANICSIHIKRHRANVLFFHEEKSCRISKTIPNNRNSKNRPYFHHSFNKHPKYIHSNRTKHGLIGPITTLSARSSLHTRTGTHSPPRSTDTSSHRPFLSPQTACRTARLPSGRTSSSPPSAGAGPVPGPGTRRRPHSSRTSRTAAVRRSVAACTSHTRSSRRSPPRGSRGSRCSAGRSTRFRAPRGARRSARYRCGGPHRARIPRERCSAPRTAWSAGSGGAAARIVEPWNRRNRGRRRSRCGRSRRFGSWKRRDPRRTRRGRRGLRG